MYTISGIMDKGQTDNRLEGAISRIYTSEAARFVGDEAIQIFRGMGFEKSYAMLGF